MKAPTTISKPVKFACLLPPVECGKETFFSHGTTFSTLHQVKFNYFHFLESIGISLAGGGAERRAQNKSVLPTFYLGVSFFFPP